MIAAGTQGIEKSGSDSPGKEGSSRAKGVFPPVLLRELKSSLPRKVQFLRG
jgi:hypothetical protein